MRYLTLSLLLLLPAGGICAPDAAPAPAATAPDAAPPAAPKIEAGEPEVEPEPTVGEVLEKGADVVGAVRKASEDGSFAAWAAALSALFYMLIAVSRKWLGMLAPANTVRWVTIGLGAAAALTGYFAAGLPWGEALQLFFAGPGAIIFAELRKMPKKAEG